MRRNYRCGYLGLALLSVSAITFTSCSGEARVARPYVDTSIWNDTITQKGGTLASSNPLPGEFGTMFFGGGTGSPANTGHDDEYSKPIYIADPGAPCRTVTLRNPSWNNSNTKIPAGDCVPVPVAMKAATGSDGHLTVINAALDTAWDFWRCSQGSDSGPPCTEANVLAGNFQASNGSKWRLHPGDSLATGVASCCGSATGRGSGLELLSTVLKQDEAQYGIDHVMGLSLPGGASNAYINPPAIKSDGNSSNPIKYGSLWALRSDYPCPSAQGPKNVCQALKDYGAFIEDQGSSGSEIDTTGDIEDGSHPQPAARWQALGLTRNSLPIQGADWRCVELPSVTGECP